MVVLAGLGGAGCQQPESVICPSGRICPKGYTCTPHDDVCIFGPCGNGIWEPDQNEVCDDGNKNNDDGCSNDCKSDNTCGNGIVDDKFADVTRREFCDQGNLNGQPGHCSADCKSSGLCGNGIRDNGEDCDFCVADDAAIDASGDAMSGGDGSADGSPGDGSPGDASGDAQTGPRICALGITESRECNDNCTTAKCGDRRVNHAAGEECDEGRETRTCNVDCTSASCGDGKVNASAEEQCDVRGGADTINCNGESARSAGKACHFSECGDGYVNAAAGESCDVLGGADSRDCNGKNGGPGVGCRSPRCGDGYVNPEAGETCDTLGGGDTADCNGSAATSLGKACLAPKCGDGYINRAIGETCEVPADGSNTGTCNGINAGALKCTLSACGDTYINAAAGETCEPQPGGADTAGCNGKDAGSVRCMIPRCGDGYLNTLANETCEVSTTGADTGTCNGINAPMALRCHAPSCGDGYPNGAAGETCDDLGGVDSLACNGTSAGNLRCKVPACGDGYLNVGAGEECDDHNPNSNDGCSAICKKEAGFNCPSPGSACTPICGDGTQVTGEACDDYNTSPCGTCSANCGAAQAPGTATGTITVGSMGNGVTFNNLETFSLSDGIHGRVTFRFTSSSAAPPAGTVFIDIASNTSGPQMANKIAAAIQGVGRALAINAGVNPSNSRQVVLVNSNPGSVGNQPVNETVGSSNFGVTGMAGGVGYDCADAVGCRDGRDCGSGVCGVSHLCLSATCADGVLNGTETDTDCGGNSGSCSRCADGAGCILDSDCGAASQCTAGVCANTCGDSIKNGSETDTDCGGGCGPCADGKQCNTSQDCQAGSQCGVPPPPPPSDGGAVDAGTATPVCF